MRGTGNHDSADSDTNQKSPATSSAEKISATLALDYVIVKIESIDDVPYYEAPVETKDTE
jgi:hypothetical protein